MYFYLVAPFVVVRQTEHAYTYHSQTPLAIGSVVRISVGKKEVNGLVTAVVNQKPTFTTKAINSVITPRPLPKPLIALGYWMSEYYATHLAITLQTLLPTGLHKKRRVQTNSGSSSLRKRTKIVLNDAQRRAIIAANKRSGGTILLHGVTGAGKTQVYIEAAKHQARKGKSTIILVPEIALTPQLVSEFSHHFQNLVVTHSQMTEADRHHTWLRVLNNDEPTIVIGPRSALFMPVSNLGLIVIDECHEPSYKQEQSPRYSALRAASMLAKFNEATVLLGSATPSVHDYYLAQVTKSPIINLPRAIAAESNTAVEVVDLGSQGNFRKHRLFSNTLLAHIQQALQNKQQTLLFHNRRGTSPTTLCEHCGWMANCPTCYIPLTLHADIHQLRCHLCAFKQSPPTSCPICKQPTITFKGIGTKLIETEISKLFPEARIMRFDADTATTDTVQARYKELYSGDIDIMIGTQVLAKGLDLPHLSVVGIVQADSGLALPDFGAEERTFQLIYQVIGRTGRTHGKGHVVVQTYHPQHPAVTAAIDRDYQRFYRAEIKKREIALFPPFRYLLKLVCSYKTEKGAITASKKLAQALRSEYPNLEILGPTPAFHERLGGNYRWQLLIKSKQRNELVSIVQGRVPAGWQADLDPASLL